MKILVTGYAGQLGYDVVKELNRRNIECIGTTRDTFDLTDADRVKALITQYHPEGVIHCAAYTAVDKAEDEPEICQAVNAAGTENIAKACAQINAKLLYISTDYVFPGTGEQYYEVNDRTAPLSVYGKTKLAGENAVKAIIDKHFIVRVSWVFGKNGNNFVKTMLKLAKERDELSIVADQIGSPTYTADLAPLLCDMIATKQYGTYHATNEGICSWAEFAQEIFRQAGSAVNIKPVPSAEYPTKALRPLNSRMSKSALAAAGFKQLPPWQDAVRRFLREIEKHSCKS